MAHLSCLFGANELADGLDVETRESSEEIVRCCFDESCLRMRAKADIVVLG